MRKAPYLSSHEFNDYVKIAVFAEELRAIAGRTSEKDWAKDLRIASTKVEKIARARIECLDNINLMKVRRRVDHTELRFVTNDENRGKEKGLMAQPSPQITIDEDDFLFLVKVVDIAVCQNCGRKDVKDCEIRKLWHNLGMVPSIDNPKEDECEFKDKEKEQ